MTTTMTTTMTTVTNAIFLLHTTRRSIRSVVFSLVVLATAIASGSASAYECPNGSTPPLVLRGKRFYDSSSGDYVPIRGIAYYPRPNAGPLSEGSSVDFYTDEYASLWRADIANLKQLGVNAVRIYAVDPSANHDAFLCALSEAGIYVMLSLLADCEGCAIGAWVGKDAEPPLCYTESVKERGRFIARSFSKYPNVMAFSAGNEVTIYADDGAGGPREINAPCQKKFLRDMREYVAGCAGSYDGAVLPRAVPIGVVNWDGNAQSFLQHVYYHCRTDPEDVFENAEWFALNSYRHCDGSVTDPSDIVGWRRLRIDFQDANLPGPVLIGEYGCRERGFPTMGDFVAQRTWLQTEALYSPDYSDVFAGGFVFEYSAEKTKIDANLRFEADRQELEEPASEWPYETFAKTQYGVGYFGPSDCEHETAGSSSSSGTAAAPPPPPCEYTKYPEWDGLVDALAGSVGAEVRPQTAGAIPECPSRFAPLSAYEWPTDSGDDPALDYCLALKSAPEEAAPTDVQLDAPSVPATDSPTVVLVDATTTESPTTVIVFGTESGTGAPTGDEPDTEAPETEAPTTVPTTNDRCSDHFLCAAQNLTGACCPTFDGVVLGCCDPFLLPALAAEGSESSSAAPPQRREAAARATLSALAVSWVATMLL